MVAPTSTPVPQPVVPAPAAQANGMIPDEWPTQAADTIVDVIGKVRDKTTKPAIVVARALVYGLIAAVVGTVSFIVLLILTVRLYDNYVPGNVWPLYAAFFAIFSIGGLTLLKKANAPASSGS